ncbi:hypothetical protein [Burkholderia gladioli]|uniref:hypothetical protein n=1 Tax=Burkholderia gladioli TaxID=28095 RepID=UPI0016409DB2|nr:hypothetical protein [Burkholderia gladioli]
MTIQKEAGTGRAQRSDQAASLTLLHLDLAKQIVKQIHPQGGADLDVEVAKIIATNYQTLTLNK